MAGQIKTVTLDTIGGGALAELFQVEMDRVLANIADVNTEAKVKRAIHIEVVLTPRADRQSAEVDVRCSSKLAGVTGVSTQFYMGNHAGKRVAVENDPRQAGLFDQPQAAQVSPFPVAAGERT